MSINPLANPKDIKLNCELCQNPAYIQCTKCRVTYYCGVDHQKADWIGIHEKICQLLIPLRTPDPFFSSQEDRQHRKAQTLHRQKNMIDLTRTTGQKLLFEGKHEQAIPAAMQSLRFAIQVHGLASIELVPSYLILGEASIGLNNLTQAEEYLSQAQWTVLKTPDVSDAMKSKLYRNIGYLYAATGEYTEALRQLADDVYHSSLAFGTDDIRTSGGYFHMANIFHKQDQMDTANSLYEKVAGIWFDHLHKIITLRRTAAEKPKGLLESEEEEEEEENGLDEAQEAEAVQVLNAILDVYDTQNASADAIARVAFALAMLYYILHDIPQAKEHGRKAIVSTQNSRDDEFTHSVVDFMKFCDRVPSSTL